MKDFDKQHEQFFKEYLDSGNKVLDFIHSNRCHPLDAIEALALTPQQLLKISDKMEIGKEMRDIVISILKDSECNK